MSALGVIKLSGKPISSKQVLVSFQALPGTNPAEQGHFISIWKGRKVLGPAMALFTHMISTSCQSDQVVFNDLAIGDQEYIIGYGIDGHEGMETICATLLLSLNAETGRVLPASMSDVFVSPDHIGTDALLAHLAIPFYYQDKHSFKWIALFQGDFHEHMYSGVKVMGVSKCFMPQNCETILMRNIPERLIRFETYTLVHGIGLDARGGPDYTKLISYHTFVVWKSSIYIGTGDQYLPGIPKKTYPGANSQLQDISQ